MKTCTKCKIEYPATTEYFYRRKDSKDGLQPVCKPCNNRANKRRRATKQGKEARRLEYKRYSSTKQGKAKILAGAIKYQKTLNYKISKLISSIKQRCYNSNHVSYKNYGGRGIKLEFTRKELEVWLLENGIDPRGLQIHRKDNDKNYTLDNIEFMSHAEHNKTRIGKKYRKKLEV